MTFGARLREIRTQKGLTLQEIADHVGVKVTMAGHWERRQALAPPAERVRQLSEILGVEHASELLELAHRDRGKIAVDLQGLSDSAISLLTELERLCRDGKLTAKKAKEIRELLANCQ